MGTYWCDHYRASLIIYDLLQKTKVESVPAFLSELPLLATINSLSKTDLISRLFTAVDLLENKFIINDSILIADVSAPNLKYPSC